MQVAAALAGLVTLSFERWLGPRSAPHSTGP